MHKSTEQQATSDQLRQDTLAAWNDYRETGLHLTEEEADAWLEKLEAGEGVEAPECHI